MFCNFINSGRKNLAFGQLFLSFFSLNDQNTILEPPQLTHVHNVVFNYHADKYHNNRNKKKITTSFGLKYYVGLRQTPKNFNFFDH